MRKQNEIAGGVEVSGEQEKEISFVEALAWNRGGNKKFVASG